MRVYLAGPMRGIPQFNFPAFFKAADELRQAGHTVFNPAERDTITYGREICDSPTGDIKDVAHLGVSIRKCLGEDTAWICKNAEAIVLLPGWSRSLGARAEKALAEALGLIVMFITGEQYD